jgi:hypothetical protein
VLQEKRVKIRQTDKECNNGIWDLDLNEQLRLTMETTSYRSFQEIHKTACRKMRR